jgi:cytosine/adenosine deaminase-related metal-dependent hydrolase
MSIGIDTEGNARLKIDSEKVLAWLRDNEWFLGPWAAEVLEMAVRGQSDYRSKQVVHGLVDAHVHLDRVFTYDSEFFPPGINLNEIADLPLEAKQDLVGFLHEGKAYTRESLYNRMSEQIERAVKIGTREIGAVIDTTPDIGLGAFEAALDLKQRYSDVVDLKVGCYPLFGFKNPENQPDRYEIVAEAAPRSDLIVGLPEKDDRPDRIGFKGHTSLVLKLAYKYRKEAHIHVDQKNSAYERGAFQVIECLESLTPQEFTWYTEDPHPKLWLVHMISPSCYDGETFSRLVNFLVKYNIGVICCPTAGISMNPPRSENTPTHNSIARLPELLRCGVEVKFGTDNVNDYLVPSGSGLILREIEEVSNYVRKYVSHILVKAGMGISLNNGDRAILAKSLQESYKFYVKHRQWVSRKKEEETENLKDSFQY